MVGKKTSRTNQETLLGKTVSIYLEDDTKISGKIVKVEKDLIWIQSEGKKAESCKMDSIRDVEVEE